MRSLMLVLAAVVLFISLGWLVPRLPAPSRPEPDPPAAGLKLLAAGPTGPVMAGDRPGIALTLANVSGHTTYRIVRPGDGSHEGRREPHVFLTATRTRPDGRDEPVPKARHFVCGVFDRDWAKDVILLPPGERLDLGYDIAHFEFQQPGRVSLRAHYRYSAGGIIGLRPEERTAMDDTPPFEVVSEPVEFDVVRPFEVRLRLKGPMKAGAKHRLSDLLEVEVINSGPGPVELGDPDGYRWSSLKLEVDAKLGWHPRFDDPKGDTRGGFGRPRGLGRELLAGGRASMFGPGRLDGDWTYPLAETVRVRAVFAAQAGNLYATAKSDWVELRVEP